MQHDTFDYKKRRSEIFLQYGIELDETSISILYILQIEQKRNFEKQIQKLDVAVSKINSSNRSLELDTNHPRWQAFWFGIGQWGLALFSAIILSSIFYGYYLYDNNQNQKTNDLFMWYKLYYDNSRADSKKDFLDFIKNNPMPQ